MALYLRTRIVIGLSLIIIGVLFILNNYGIEIIPSDFLTWEYFFILLGALLLILSKNKTLGTILIALGFFNLYPELWPLIFVIIGLYIIFSRRGYHKIRTWNEYHHRAKESAKFMHHEFLNNTYKAENKTKFKSAKEFIEEVSVFGGSTKVLHTDNFRGGSIISIFGGSEINLSDCKLAEGENVLEITAIFGGASLIVPSDWKIEIDVLPIFGGFGDKRIKNPKISFDEGKILVIKGLVLFGGGEIKNQ